VIQADSAEVEGRRNRSNHPPHFKISTTRIVSQVKITTAVFNLQKHSYTGKQAS
jgi:hypothetical protein